MRYVVLFPFVMGLGLGSQPAFASDIGLPTSTFVQSWTALPRGHFTLESLNGPFKLLKARTMSPSDAQIAPLLDDALASARDEAERRGLALSEMATSWDQEKRSAFERLREAEAAYAETDGSRHQRFVATLSRLVDGTGRSAATDGSASAAVDSTYAAALARDTGSARVAAETAQEAWRSYRDAFAEFADLHEPGSADGVTAELDRQRANDLAGPTR